MLCPWLRFVILASFLQLWSSNEAKRLVFYHYQQNAYGHLISSSMVSSVQLGLKSTLKHWFLFFANPTLAAIIKAIIDYICFTLPKSQTILKPTMCTLYGENEQIMLVLVGFEMQRFAFASFVFALVSKKTATLYY